MSKGLPRFILFLAVFVLTVILPWWISAIILLVLTLYIPFYVEIIFFGFMIDAIYSDIQTFFPYGLVVTTAFFLAVYFLRDRIRT